MTLVIKDLAAGYGGAAVLTGLSLNVPDSHAVALFGRNGSGKSTLLRAISGLLPFSGSVTIDGTELAGITPEEIARIGVAHVPQGRGTFVNFTVEQNLRLAGTLMKSRAAIRSRLEWILETLPILADRRRQMAGLLSGGEQQLLAIGRALMMRPSLILLDEPSLGLAPRMIGKVFEVLAGLREGAKTSFLVVEQNPAVTVGFVDRAHLLEGGSIVLSASAADPALREQLLSLQFAG